MKEPAQDIPQITDTLPNSPSTSNLGVLKAAGVLIAGSILVSYVATKYYKDPFKSAIDWVMGIPKPKRRKKSLKNKNKLKNMRRHKKRLGEELYYEEDNSSDNDSNRRKFLLNKKDMSYISEENTDDIESSLCDDLLVPLANDDCTSITFSEKRTKKIYLDSGDELVEAGKEEDSSSNYYVQPSKTNNIKHKLYSQRKIEAKKFVHEIDHAVNSFKKNMMKNYATYNEAFKANQKISSKEKKEQVSKDVDLKEPNSLNDKYRAEIQQLSPKSRKQKFKEESVRLDEFLSEATTVKKDSDVNSTFFSKNAFRSKGGKEKFVPNSREFTNKNDYIFFELFSVYTENFVESKQVKNRNRKR